MKKGDIILIPFPFTDLTGNKLRPALVLARNLKDITVAFITSQIELLREFDISIKPNGSNGIKKESIIKLTKIATIESSLAVGKLGEVDTNKLIEVNDKLKLYLDL